jgi:intracellular septation protein
MASINAYVAYEFSTEDWVNFKIWGYIFPLTFIVGTGIYIAKHVAPTAHNAEDEASK